MKLYQLLFPGLMAPADDNGAASGGADRGDDFTPTEPAAAPAAVPAAAAAAEDDDAVGAADDAPARDAGGKFAKREREDGGAQIPKARFDDAVAKERARAEAAERRAAELEKAAAQVSRNIDVEKAVADVADLRKQERKALLDGDDDKAAALAAQADRLNRQIAIAESGHMTGQAKEQALEDMRMELTIERLEEKYPMLRVDSEEYDEDILDDILDKQAGLMQRERLSPSAALRKAAESVMSRRQAAAPAAGPKAGLAAAQGGDTRKGAAVAKNLDAAARQPGSLKDVGMDSHKAGQTQSTPAASDLTHEEFIALPEATRAQMRGDYI